MFRKIKEGRESEFEQKFQELKPVINTLLMQKTRLVYCDSSLTTYETLKKVAHSLPRRPITILQDKIERHKAFNLLAAVSAENGTEYFKVIEGYVNSSHVAELL